MLMTEGVWKSGTVAELDDGTALARIVLDENGQSLDVETRFLCPRLATTTGDDQ